MLKYALRGVIALMSVACLLPEAPAGAAEVVISIPKNSINYQGSIATFYGSLKNYTTNVARVEASMQDLTGRVWWNGTYWVVKQTWLPCTGTTDWSFASPKWESSHEYKLYARTVMNSGAVEDPPTGAAFGYQVYAPFCLVEKFKTGPDTFYKVGTGELIPSPIAIMGRVKTYASVPSSVRLRLIDEANSEQVELAGKIKLLTDRTAEWTVEITTWNSGHAYRAEVFVADEAGITGWSSTRFRVAPDLTVAARTSPNGSAVAGAAVRLEMAAYPRKNTIERVALADGDCLFEITPPGADPADVSAREIIPVETQAMEIVTATGCRIATNMYANTTPGIYHIKGKFAGIEAEEITLTIVPDDEAPMMQLVEPDSSYKPGKSAKIYARLYDNSRIQEARIYYKPFSGRSYENKQMEREQDDLFWAEIPGDIGGIVDYYVEAKDPSGKTSFSSFGKITFSDGEAPAAPTFQNVAVYGSETGSGSGIGKQVVLTWRKSPSRDVVGYRIYRSGVKGERGALIADPAGQPLPADPSGATLIYVDVTALVSQYYYYTIVCYDSGGQTAETSMTVDMTAQALQLAGEPCPVLDGCNGPVEALPARFTVEQPTFTVARMEIYRSDNPREIGRMVGEGTVITSWQEESLYEGRVYYYTLVRYMDDQQKDIETIAIMPEVQPAAPTAITATPNGAGFTVSITSGSGPDICKYEIHQIMRDGSLKTIAELTPEAASVQLPAGMVEIVVNAVDSAGIGGAFTLVPLGAPEMPKAAVVSVEAGTPIRIEGDPKETYVVYRREKGGLVEIAKTGGNSEITDKNQDAGVAAENVRYEYVYICECVLTSGKPPAPVTIVKAPPAAASIRVPADGKRLRGNAVTVIARADSNTVGVQFQYKYAPSTGVWTNITGMDSKQPYAVYWNLAGLLNGEYGLRAVAYNRDGVADTAPVVTSVFLDDVNADIIEDGNPAVDPNKPHRKEEVIAPNEDQVVETADGTAVMITSGTLQQEARLVVETVPPAEEDRINPPFESELKPVGVARKLEFKNGPSSFEQPVTVQFPVPEQNQFPDEQLGVYTLQTDSKGNPVKWTEVQSIKTNGTIVANSRDNMAKSPSSASSSAGNRKFLEAQLMHFSIYAVFARVPKTDLTEVIAFPNPVNIPKGDDRLTLDGLTPGCKISIYTLAGRMVLQTDAPDAGRWQWDLRNSDGQQVASGVYFFTIRDARGNRTKGKVAVLR